MTGKQHSYETGTTREKPTVDDTVVDVSDYLNREHIQTVNRLNKLSGAAFDREFLKVMVANRQKAKNFLQAQKTVFNGNTPVHMASVGLCERLLLVVQSQLDQARSLQQEMRGTTTTKRQLSGTRSLIDLRFVKVCDLLDQLR